MKIIDTALLDRVTEEAAKNKRLRMNYNFHESTDDPVNRLLNALEPGTYVIPHRHLAPPKDEICLVLRGSLINFIFDEHGNITGKYLLDASKGKYGMEIEPGVWHCAVSLEPGTMLYEIKHGPYAPLAGDNMAPWAPLPEDEEGAREYMKKLLEDQTVELK